MVLQLPSLNPTKEFKFDLNVVIEKASPGHSKIFLVNHALIDLEVCLESLSFWNIYQLLGIKRFATILFKVLYQKYDPVSFVFSLLQHVTIVQYVWPYNSNCLII